MVVDPFLRTGGREWRFDVADGAFLHDEGDTVRPVKAWGFGREGAYRATRRNFRH